MTLTDDIQQAQQLPAPKRARMIRAEAGVSQERLARELGVHRVTLARWESGDSLPRGLEIRARYAQLLADLRMASAA